LAKVGNSLATVGEEFQEGRRPATKRRHSAFAIPHSAFGFVSLSL
jgi:hypothetical protein